MLGEPMALSLLKAGTALSVYYRTPEKASALAAQGADLKADPWEVAEPSGIKRVSRAYSRAGYHVPFRFWTGWTCRIQEEVKNVTSHNI